MDRLQERIAYMEGLADGLDLFDNKKEGKFYSELIGVITELNQTLIHTTDRLSELEEYVEAIDEDLNDIEWDYYEDDDELLELDEEDFELDDDNDEETITYYEVECPTCKETIMVDRDLANNSSEIECPSCQEMFIIEDEGEYMHQ